jgi:hypothetical protein
MVEVKHTPTPWAYEDTGDIAGLDPKCTERPTVGRVGDCRIVRDGAFRYDDHAEDHEDAAFVCLAVNSYAADQERIRVLEEALKSARECLDGEPEYHHSGMGCGLEDRNIRDRYDAMYHGWECAIERVYSEHVNGAVEIIDAALSTEAKS